MLTSSTDKLEHLVAIHTTQAHGAKWILDEITILSLCIQESKSVEDVMEILSQRSKGAVLYQANKLGYGQRYNADDNKTYFTDEINHTSRRTKEEILAESGKVPILSAKPVEESENKSTDIIAKESNIKLLKEILLRQQQELIAFYEEQGVGND